jgi:hypothetical protein
LIMAPPFCFLFDFRLFLIFLFVFLDTIILLYDKITFIWVD